MYINKIKGIIDLKSKRDYSIEGENDLVIVDLILDNEKVPLVVSSYVLKKYEGECAIDCTIGQEQKAKGYRFTYLYATKIALISELPDKMQKLYNNTLIRVGDRITHMCRPQFVGTTYDDCQKAKLSSKNGGRGHLLLDVTAIGGVARKMSALTKYWRLKAVCYVKMTADGKIKFYAQSISYKPPLPLKNQKEV